MEYDKLLRTLEILHVKLADSTSYDALLEQKLNWAVEAVENCLRYPRPERYHNTLYNSLKKLERASIDAHGSSKVSNAESLFARWRKRIEEEMNSDEER